MKLRLAGANPDDLTFSYVGTTIGIEMAFVRVKRRGKKTYYYLVESYREGKKVKQRVICYLGTRPPTKEQLESTKGEK